MVLVLDREDRLNALAMDFAQHALHIIDAAAPRNVVGVWPLLVDVLEMEADDAALELFETLDGVQSGARPMARVRSMPPTRLLNPFVALRTVSGFQ